MKGFWVRYRLAAAQARARLVAAAGEAWDVPAAEVEIENGVVRHSSGKKAPIGELAARAEQLPVPDGVEPKDPGDYKLIGREGRLRVDAVPKILGATQFTIDLSLPEMLTAVVLHPPRFGATVASVVGEVVLGDGGEIITQNFDRYPIMRMRSVPVIEVHLIDSTESPTGVGEVSVPSLAPALANAIAALTGTRIRKLPISKTIKIY